MIDYTAVYGTLRSQLLGRHALVNRRFRSNRFSDSNHLKFVPDEILGDPDPASRAVKAWTIDGYTDGNPLMATGKLLTCLAIEHHLGSTTAAPTIRALLGGLEALFKFQGDDFDGYILRGDPVDFDTWRERRGPLRPSLLLRLRGQLRYFSSRGPTPLGTQTLRGHVGHADTP